MALRNYKPSLPESEESSLTIEKKEALSLQRKMQDMTFAHILKLKDSGLPPQEFQKQMEISEVVIEDAFWIATGVEVEAL